MVDEDFIKAAVPEPVQILGLSLRPFSLGHYLLLARFDNGFLDGEASVDDLILGVLVCSMTFEEGSAFLSAHDRDQQVVEWSKKLKANLRKEGLELDIVDKSDLFSKYITEGMRVPNYSYTEGGSTEVGSPWPQILRVGLMSNLGLSESEVMNRPLRLSWWDYLSWREMNGKGVKLISNVVALQEAQVAADEFDRKIRAKIMACPEKWRAY